MGTYSREELLSYNNIFFEFLLVSSPRVDRSHQFHSQKLARIVAQRVVDAHVGLYHLVGGVVIPSLLRSNQVYPLRTAFQEVEDLGLRLLHEILSGVIGFLGHEEPALEFVYWLWRIDSLGWGQQGRHDVVASMQL